MNKKQRFSSVFAGIVMIACSILFLIYNKDSVELIIGLLSLSLLIRSLQLIVYYLTMARYKIEGKMILYEGVVMFSIAMFAVGTYDIPAKYAMIYLLGVHAFAGAVDILRAREAKAFQTDTWKWKMLQGVFQLLLAIVGLFFLTRTKLFVLIYSAGLAYSGILKLIDAFRKNEVEYIN